MAQEAKMKKVGPHEIEVPYDNNDIWMASTKKKMSLIYSSFRVLMRENDESK